MTPDEEKQWNCFGCVPRCLLKLAGNPMTKEEFYGRFKEAFLDPEKQLGLLKDEGFNSVLKPLGLPTTVRQSDNYSIIDNAFNNEKRKVLLLSHVNLNQGQTDEKHHCTILTKLDVSGFSVWSPDQSGADIPMDFEKSDWKLKQFSGLVFFD